MKTYHYMANDILLGGRYIRWQLNSLKTTRIFNFQMWTPQLSFPNALQAEGTSRFTYILNGEFFTSLLRHPILWGDVCFSVTLIRRLRR